MWVLLTFCDMLICVCKLGVLVVMYNSFFFFKQKTAYEMRISDWSSDVCSSDLQPLLSDSPSTATTGLERPWQRRDIPDRQRVVLARAGRLPHFARWRHAAFSDRAAPGSSVAAVPACPRPGEPGLPGNDQHQ